MAKTELEIEINVGGNVTDEMESIIESVTDVSGSLAEMAALMSDNVATAFSDVSSATDDMVSDLRYSMSGMEDAAADGFGAFGEAAGEAAANTTEAADASEDATSAMDILGGVAAAVAVGFIAVGAAIYGAISAVWSFVEAAGESEIVEWRLDATLQALGETAEVTFGGMSDDLRKSLDKMGADMAKAQDKLLGLQQNYEEKTADMTKDTMLKVRRYDEDTRDAREKLVDDLKDSLAIKERKVGEATTAERRKAAQTALNDARKAADERLAEFDAERAKRRSRMMEDTAIAFTELEEKYRKESGLAQAAYDETARLAADANKLAAEQAAKTISIVRPTKTEIMKLADEISTASGFDDEELISGMTKLLRMVPTGSENFKELAGYAADLAAVGDKDIATAFQGIALFAQTGDIGRLKRDLGELTPAQAAAMKAAQDTGNAFEIQAVALDILRANFGDAGSKAAEYGSTFEGLMGKLSTSLGNAKEAIGGPALAGIEAALNTILPSLTEAGKAFGELMGTPEMQQRIRDFGTWIGNELVPLIEKGINWLANDAPIMLENFSAWFDENSPTIKEDIGQISNLISQIGTVISAMWTIAGPILKFFVEYWMGVYNAVTKVFDYLFGDAVRAVKTIMDYLAKLTLPDWLVPGSPTPLELGLRGIKSAMDSVSASGGGVFGGGIQSMQRSMPAMGGGITVVYSPTMSLGNRAEFEAQLVPVLSNAMRRLNRGAV